MPPPRQDDEWAKHGGRQVVVCRVCGATTTRVICPCLSQCPVHILCEQSALSRSVVVLARGLVLTVPPFVELCLSPSSRTLNQCSLHCHSWSPQSAPILPPFGHAFLTLTHPSTVCSLFFDCSSFVFASPQGKSSLSFDSELLYGVTIG